MNLFTIFTFGFVCGILSLLLRVVSENDLLLYVAVPVLFVIGYLFTLYLFNKNKKVEEEE